MQSQNELNAKKAGRFSFTSVALLLLLYVALPSFVLSVFLLLRTGSPRLAYWTALALIAGGVFYRRKKLGIWDVLVFLALLIFCHAVSYLFFDTFFDGLSYHQPAVRRIAEGVNPIYDGYMDLGRSPDSWSDQATYFPKATWYFAAVVTAVWGDIQLGTAYHPLLFFAALFFIWGSTEEEPFWKRLLWVLACLNPIALTQFTGYVVDGALATLSTVGIFYAYLFFRGHPSSLIKRFFCIVSISLLFGVKTSGVAYGSILLFWITLHRFAQAYQETETGKTRAGVRAAFQLGLKLGCPILLLVSIWNFAPYITNVLNGRHIFYPLFRADGAGVADLSGPAQIIYPQARNSLTRLLVSIASHTTERVRPAELKNPFDVSWADWVPFSSAANIRAAGLGPLFFLFLLFALPCLFFFRPGKGVGWLLSMLLTMVFIQPYAWQMRYAPFLWFFPLTCFLSIPEEKKYFFYIPFCLALANTLGVFALFAEAQWNISRTIEAVCSIHRGQPVLLDRSVLEWDGVFDRFQIRQKFANPEETNFYSPAPELGSLSRARTDRGVNLSFVEDLLPVPEDFLDFTDGNALPWLRMSEGLMPVDAVNDQVVWRSYADKVKFYMALSREPWGDWELSLEGQTFGGGARGLTVLVSVNHQEVGIWRPDEEFRVEKFSIPQILMEESSRDEMRLVTLTLRLNEVPSLIENFLEPSSYGLQLKGFQLKSLPLTRDNPFDPEN
ncbi:MAG: hypothetical protein LBD04_08085 [Synergistaceae bacterium]|nr:hypothetical protein [Synergistaceae bacterium]